MNIKAFFLCKDVKHQNFKYFLYSNEINIFINADVFGGIPFKLLALFTHNFGNVSLSPGIFRFVINLPAHFH